MATAFNPTLAQKAVLSTIAIGLLAFTAFFSFAFSQNSSAATATITVTLVATALTTFYFLILRR